MAVKPAVPVRGGEGFTDATSNAGAGWAHAGIVAIPNRISAPLRFLIPFIVEF
jgi:hypothetical protein